MNRGFPDFLGGGGGGGGGGRFVRNVRVYAPVFLSVDKPDLARRMEQGDKVVLPAMYMSELDATGAFQLGIPLIFEVEAGGAGAGGRKTHVGMLEFAEDHDSAFFPLWIMRSLRIEDGGLVKLTLRTLPPIAFVKLGTKDSRFSLRLEDPKPQLEDALSRYTALTVGDELIVDINGEPFAFEVKEIRPETASRAASLFDTSVEVEFDVPQSRESSAGGASAGGGAFPSAPHSPIRVRSSGGAQEPSSGRPPIGGDRRQPARVPDPHKLEVGETASSVLGGERRR